MMPVAKKARHGLVRLSVAALTAVALAVGAAGAAQASPGPGDDRMVSTPTAWWTYQNIDASSLSSHLAANNARLTDLRVMSGSPLRFSATMVSNAGAYASGWYWYYGITMAQVNANLTANNARLITAQRYYNGSAWVYAVVMVPNTGANAKAWWWVDGTFNDVLAWVNAHNARPTTLSTYEVNGQRRYVAILNSNTGSDAYAWYWYFGISATTLQQVQSPYNSVLDISVNSDDTFNAVLVSGLPTVHGVVQGTTWFAPSPSSIVNSALAQSERPTLLTSYVLHGTGTTNGQTEWVAVFRDNY